MTRRALSHLTCGTLVVLTWEDLGADLMLTARVDEADAAMGAQTDAAAAGLSAALLAIADAQRATFVARLRTPPQDRPVSVRRHDIIWDGKDFTVQVAEHQLGARATEASL